MKLNLKTFFDMMENDPEYCGAGYLASGNRCPESDGELLAAAYMLDLKLELLFLWCNSRPGRHFMDNYDSKVTGTERVDRFVRELVSSVPELIAETQLEAKSKRGRK